MWSGKMVVEVLMGGASVFSTGERVVLNREFGNGERGGSVSIRAMGTFSSGSAVEISCGEEALGGRLETVAELVMPK